MSILDYTQVSPSTRNGISKIIRDEFRKQFQKVRNDVTGTTLKTIRVKVKVTQFSITWDVYAGPGYFWAERGKKANTKLPVVKKGGGWELIEPLKTWHSIKTPGMPEFVLANILAKKARSPIPITKNAAGIVQSKVVSAVLGSDIGKNIILGVLKNS